MDHLLRRHVWVVDLIGIVIGAALAGHAAALLISTALLPHTALPARHNRTVKEAALAPAPKSIEGIVGRNIFCSSCGDEPAPAQSPRSFTLLAIMFAPPPLDQLQSVAIVRDDETETAGPYTVGAKLGDATVSVIENVRVVLDVSGGRREVLELLTPRSRDRVPSEAGALDAGIRQTGTHRYEVRRAVIDRLLKGGVTPPWPRVVPEARGGDPIGFRIMALRPDGPFPAIGLVNGDLLLQVNGRALATPDAALGAFTALRASDHVWLLIERDGRQLRLDYFIR